MTWTRVRGLLIWSRRTGSKRTLRMESESYNPEESVSEPKSTPPEVVPMKKELPHNVALEQARELVAKLLHDPFLQDLPKDATVGEVGSVLALEQGHAITINLRRFDDQVVLLIVMQGATVGNLMKAVEKEVQRRCAHNGQTQHICWKYIWKSYWLVHGQQRLENKQTKLTNYGVGNKADVSFVKRLRREHKGKRRRAHPAAGN